MDQPHLQTALALRKHAMAAELPGIAFELRDEHLQGHYPTVTTRFRQQGLAENAFQYKRKLGSYLCLLFGRPAPRDLARWNNRDIDALLAAFTARPPRASRLRASS